MDSTAFLFGIDALLASDPSWKTHRIGLLTNDAARTQNGEKSRVALLKQNYQLVRLFSPEHGMKAQGKDGAWMSHQIDEITKLPIVSLYQEQQQVNDENIDDLDVLMVDLPDVGVRFYTYLWSMTYFIEAAARKKKKIVILDRPNPLGGAINKSEGPMLSNNCSSFIGRFNIPVTHYCTLGELAHYFNKTERWDADLFIIQCQWKRENTYEDWGIPWVSPSPALVNFKATLLYPGLCFLEATNFSFGRNTAHSFQWIGSEVVDISSLEFTFPGISLSPQKISTSTGETIGLTISPNPDFNSPVLFGLELLFHLNQQFNNYFSWEPYPTQANPSGENHLDLLLGIPKANHLLLLDQKAFRDQTKSLLSTNWEETIRPYLLYI